jgi:hypothetical protein
MTAPNTDVEDIFALAADNTSEATQDNAEASADEPGTEGTNTDENPAEGESAALYPRVLRSYKVGDPDLTEGENPPGTLTVNEFAGQLSIDNFQAGNTSLDAIVNAANIYTGVKAKREPLPVVLVYPADSDDMKDAKVFLPYAEASEVYRNRPERGTGSAATTKRTYDEMVLDAAKKLNQLKAIVIRFDRVADQKLKAEGILAKYKGWIRPSHKDDENPDEAVNLVIANKAAELEEAAALEADAAKNADIPDNAPVPVAA